VPIPDAAVIDLVARQLANNHLRNSVPDRLVIEGRKLMRPRILPRPLPTPHRIVVVLGAGASHAGCGLPLGRQAGAMLTRRLVGAGRIPRKLFMAEIERLVTEYNLREEDFETTLLALSKFDQAGLLVEMESIFGHRYFPSFTYEFLAHLAKHRMVDAIVNFNFDETLDQSLDDEIGRANYSYVASDGDLARDEPEHARPPRSAAIRPYAFDRFLYIKPHGTAGHPSSMRFTRTSYSWMAPGLRRLMNGVFKSRPTMIVIGHGMASVEFNRLLESTKPCVIWVNRSPAPDALQVEASYMIRPGTKLDDFSRRLWRAVEAAFVTNKPRDVARHELIDQIFRGTVTERGIRQEEWRYCLDRTYVELALAIAKAKGFVNLPELLAGRTGSYFRLYANGRGPERKPLLELCRDLGLHRMYSSTEAMRLGEAIEPEFSQGKCQLIVPEADFRRKIPELGRSIDRHLSRQRQGRGQFREALAQMYKAAEIEVQPSADNGGSDVFIKPMILRTFSAVQTQSSQLMEGTDWNAALCVAETGEWLAEGETGQRLGDRAKGRVAVIVADTTYRTRLMEKLQLDESCIQLLPWWLHNRHLTLLLKDGKPRAGIYFERRLRASTVVPMLISGYDARLLFRWFVIYSIKAFRWRQNRREGVIGREEIDQGASLVLDWLRESNARKPLRFPRLNLRPGRKLTT